MTVGWYAHHHGAGHRSRALAVLAQLPGVTVLSSLPNPGIPDSAWIVLPRDDRPAPGPSADPTAAETLHWVPRHHAGLAARMAAIATWIAQARPSVMVVDVSVEVALLARLHGIPTVVIAQRGRRDDAAHQLAFAQADAVIAPWTQEAHLPGDGLPDDRIRFVGALSRFDGLPRPGPPAHGGDVLLLVGAGGHALHAGDVLAAAASSGRTWHVAGPLRVEGPGVVDHGADADVAALLERCAVVVGGAGGATVGEVAWARRPFVCLPQGRPFAEQARQAEALRRLGVAVVLDAWAPAERWPAVLDAAAGCDAGRWSLLHDGRGATRLAQAVSEVLR